MTHSNNEDTSNCAKPREKWKGGTVLNQSKGQPVQQTKQTTHCPSAGFFSFIIYIHFI